MRRSMLVDTGNKTMLSMIVVDKSMTVCYTMLRAHCTSGTAAPCLHALRNTPYAWCHATSDQA